MEYWNAGISCPPPGSPKLGLFCAIAPRPLSPAPLGLASFCTIRPGRQPGCPKLGLFCTIGPSPARSPLDIPPYPSWALFRAVGTPSSVRRPGIGFVSPRLFTGPTHHNSFYAKYLPFVSALGQLGLFRIIAPRPRGPGAPGPAGNWVRFA